MTAEKSSWLKGNLDIRTRDDGSGGNITVAADAEIGGDLRVEGGVFFSDGPALSPDGIDRSLLPPATDSDPGAVTVGAGLAVDGGLVSWAPQYKTLGGESLVSGGGAYICVDPDALEIDTEGAEAAIRVKVKTSGGIVKRAGGLAADKSALQTILELTAAARTELAAGTGTAADLGKIPVLGANGKLPTSVIPSYAVTDIYKDYSENAMLNHPEAGPGDLSLRFDIYRAFIFTGGDTSDSDNWAEWPVPTDLIAAVKAEVLSEIAEEYATKVKLFQAVADTLNTVSGLYATKTALSEFSASVAANYASVTTVRGMIEGALTGYVSPSSLEASLANYAVKVHTHTSAQISDATRTGGQNADAGKAVLLSDGGKIAGAMVPADDESIVLSDGTISVSDSWLEGEVHGYTKTEVSAVSGTVLNLTKSGQVFDKSLSADATITLNTSGLVVDTGEVVEFDLFLTLGAGVTERLQRILVAPG